MSFKKLKVFLVLFKITFYISAFTFGGGYIVIPMMRRYFVHDLELITEKKLMDMSAISHSSPGAIAVNVAVLIGYKIVGLAGAIVATIGTILPPLLILSVISIFYKAFRDNAIVSALLKGMEARVAAIIVDILIDMWQGILKEENLLLTLMAPAAFIANYIFNVNVLYIISFSATLCSLQVYIKSQTNRKEGIDNE
ncbi:MAG TPA: chromate transporter [Tissierellaceae bacterium]|nr:chromate transporter [Tissierellaceae bacterium]